MEQLNKEQLVEIMIKNLNKKEYKDLPPILENDKEWTIADLFIRQLLNNGGDGFGLKNVGFVYFDIILPNKELLIKERMISKVGKNNSGFILWEDYNF
jgi:hypothetical protein